MRKILYFLLLLVAPCMTAGCQGDKKSAKPELSEDELAAIPEMVTDDVSMLVSDSGIIRYHAITPVWYSYNNTQRNYWYFPEGIELNQLDDDMQPAGMLHADTAYYFDGKKLWHLITNVHISNVRGEKFDTQELFWDQRSHKVYSDSFIHIERRQDILEGYGFTSNESFTEYEVRQTTGTFAMRQTSGEAAAFEGPAPDDGEHLAENDQPGTPSPTDTIKVTPMSPQEKAAAARERRNRLKVKN